MNSSKSYLKLTPSEKLQLINRSLEGESVSKICKEAGISRTIFYRWLKEYKAKTRLSGVKPPLSGTKQSSSKVVHLFEKANRKKHPRSLKINKEREIIKLWLQNPTYSIRDIAAKAQISTGGAWNVIGKYKQKVQDRGKKAINRHVKKTYNIFSEAHKISLIKRYYTGEAIAKIAREAGISRTIFYKWVKEYGGKSDKETVFKRKHRSGENHWRFMPEVQNLAIEIVVESPMLSLSKIAIRIKNEGHNVSKSGLYYILKRLNLTTYEQRLAYIPSYDSYGSKEEELIEKRYAFRLRISNIVPQFAVFTLFWLLISITFLTSIAQPPKFDRPHAIDTNTPGQQAGRGGEGTPAGNKPSGKAEITEPQSSGEPPLSGTKQDFGWGALAVNSPQSGSIEGESTQIGLGIVDHAGNTICDATIGLTVVNSKGLRVGTTEEARPSGECSLQSVTNTPDYLVSIPPLPEEGEYDLRINATTYEGEKKFSRKLIVRNNQEIEITRSSYPTRIFPEAKYPVEITIKVNRDFKGTISDTLPKGINASRLSSGGIVFKNSNRPERIAKWNVDLKKGETYKISYNLHFPQIWPEFYEIGPLKFTDQRTGKLVYHEERYWQVVADAME